MATSVKISNLPPGNFIQSQDEFPVSRGGETFRIAASQLVTEGENVTTSPGLGFVYGGFRTVGTRRLLYRPLSGIDGISVNTIGDTVVISASGQTPVMSNFIGNGSNVTFALTEPRSINPNNHRVDIDGVLQKPQEDYNIIGTNLVFTPQSIPPLNTKITVVSNNLVNVYDMIPSDGTVTTNKIFNNAVSTTKIADNAITTLKLSAQVVTNEKLAFDGGAFSFRNKIINGDMQIDQRYAGTAVTIGNIPNTVNWYTIDRWGAGAYKRDANGLHTSVNMASATVQQVTDSPPGFTYSLRYTVTRATTPAFNDGYWIYHTLEGNNTQDLKYGTPAALTTTLSFWVKSSISGKYSGFIRTFSSTSSERTRTYIYTYTINNANTWEYKTITIPGDTVNVPDSDNRSGMQILFDLGSGPLWNTPSPQTWTGGNYFFGSIAPNNAGYYRTADSVNLISTLGATFQITGVQFEAGSTATPFEHRPIGTELALCQRYYETGSNYDSRFGNAIFQGGDGNWYATNEISVNFRQLKRATPTMTFPYTSIGTGANVRTIFMGSSIFVSGIGTVIGGTSARDNGFYVSWAPWNTGTDAAPFFDWVASAEL